MKSLRLLVVDAYPREGRRSLAGAGGTEAGVLYVRMLRAHDPELSIDVVHPADGERPSATELATYDGAAYTGSNLSILHEDDPGVSSLVALARELLEAGVPSFGSCFAAQVAAVAMGGRCRANPKGREFGVSREIALSAAGRVHPLYRDKPFRFEAFTSHADEVEVLAPGSTLLASNPWSEVQGACVEQDGRTFWAVQYHPEYDCHEVASLCRLREKELVDQGTFASPEEARRYVDDLEALHEDPARADAAARLDLGPSLLDPAVRTVEARNWLASLGGGRRDERDRETT